MPETGYQTIPDVNRAPPVLAANWTEAGIATAFVALRLYTQSRVIRKIHISDYLIIGALVSQVINSSLLTVAMHHGVGRHMEYLSPEQRLLAMKYEFLSEPFGITGTTLARISFATFLLKFCVASRPWHWTLWSIIWIQAVGNAVVAILIFLQCQPATALWDSNAGGTCWTPQVQVISGYLIGVVNSVHDLILVVLPIKVIRSLTMELRIKITLGLVMCTSVFGFAASIVKTIELRTLGDRKDFTYATINFIIWLSIETYIIICAASVPVLRPLFLLFTRRSKHKHQDSFAFRWSVTHSRTHIPTSYFRQDSVMDPESMIDPKSGTAISPPEGLRERPDADIEKNRKPCVETTGTAVEPLQSVNTDNNVVETTEITVTYEPAT